MLISTIVAIILLYRYYLYTQKRNDRRRLLESRKIYLRDFFSRHLSYYKMLDENERELFITRTLEIETQRNVFGKDTAGIDEHLKLLVCSTFVQITFRLDEFKKEELLRFFLHPSIFFNRLFHNQIRLRSSVVRNIHVSWEDYNRGYMFSPEKLKLAIHELSHSLYSAYFEKHSFNLPEYIDWKTEAAKLMSSLGQNQQDTGLFTMEDVKDEADFFAACTVNFFHAPLSLRENYPDLYKSLAALLRQDTAEHQEISGSAAE
jgi:Mlc titration factor MtfA (ptsG expression regulator)